jgi:hypothetical protein
MTAPIETRRRFANCRGRELLSFEHRGIHFTAGVGRFENGDLAEISLNAHEHGTAVDVSERDAAISASLLLQHGCHVDTLRIGGRGQGSRIAQSRSSDRPMQALPASEKRSRYQDSA